MERKVHPKTWTYDNIDAMKNAAQVDGAVARLEPRDRDLRSGLLQAPAEDVPRFPARRPGRAQAIEGELGSGRPDRARQRAGDRRPRLALRRAGRAARADAMVLQDHQIRRRLARRARHARPLAGKSPADAEELDRPLGGLAGPLRARSEDRRRTARANWKSSPRGRTRCSAPNSWRWRRIIRSPRRRRRRIRRSPTSSTSAGTAAPRRPRSTPPRRWASTPASKRVHPFDPNWKLPVYVANFILMDYGTGAIFGCPAHDQRDLDFVNKYGLGNTPVVCPPGAGSRRPSSSPTPPMTATAA